MSDNVVSIWKNKPAPGVWYRIVGNWWGMDSSTVDARAVAFPLHAEPDWHGFVTRASKKNKTLMRAVRGSESHVKQVAEDYLRQLEADADLAANLEILHATGSYGVSRRVTPSPPLRR